MGALICFIKSLQQHALFAATSFGVCLESLFGVLQGQKLASFPGAEPKPLVIDIFILNKQTNKKTNKKPLPFGLPINIFSYSNM